MRHLFFVKRGILIGSYSRPSSKALFFGGGGGGLNCRLIKLSVQTKQICGDLFPSFEQFAPKRE